MSWRTCITYMWMTKKSKLLYGKQAAVKMPRPEATIATPIKKLCTASLKPMPELLRKNYSMPSNTDSMGMPKKRK